MNESLSLRQQQLMLANHLRNPTLFPAPQGVESRRLQIYRELFFGNIEALLAKAFPVIRSLLSEEDWQVLVRDFYTAHRCETPLFPWIAGEFAEYLLNERQRDDDYPFLAELAHYEWSETVLRHQLDTAVKNTVRQGDKPALSPLCFPLVYRFPVHRIGKDFLPQQAAGVPTCLLMYRNQGDEVKFIESNPATFRLLQLLEDDAWSDMDAVGSQLAKEMQHTEPDLLQSMVQETLDQLYGLGVVIKP
jgi:hypothetical protein